MHISECLFSLCKPRLKVCATLIVVHMVLIEKLKIFHNILKFHHNKMNKQISLFLFYLLMNKNKRPMGHNANMLTFLLTWPCTVQVCMTLRILKCPAIHISIKLYAQQNPQRKESFKNNYEFTNSNCQFFCQFFFFSFYMCNSNLMLLELDVFTGSLHNKIKT